jgi:hypothetical protein
MTEAKKSEVEKLQEEVREKWKSYKVPFDIERVDHMLSAARLAKDYTNYGHITGAILKELTGIEMKQEELDTKDLADFEKKLAEAKAKDEKAAAKENETAPLKGKAA